jgi:hypothetical protein
MIKKRFNPSQKSLVRVMNPDFACKSCIKISAQEGATDFSPWGSTRNKEVNFILLFLLTVSFLLATACKNIDSKLEKLKAFWNREEHCAVMMESEVSFVEYCFPNKSELYKFKVQYPKYSGPYDEAGHYQQLKKTGASGIIKRVNLERCPSSAKGKGIIYSWSTDGKIEEEEIPEEGKTVYY